LTTKPTLYPLLLNPILHTKVWGGRNLGDVMGKALATGEPYGESWELHDTCTVQNGPLAGRSLNHLLDTYGTDLIGAHNDVSEGFPLLVKLLDASDWLSIQVHPNDAQAAALEGEPRGKTEAWVVLHAEPDAKLVIGVEPGTTREAMAAAIREGTLEELVVYAGVSTGDVLLLEANTVHAIGPGLLIYEIQQSSDTTYRLYDWNRMGMDGKPRQLHIEKGVQVANVNSVPQVQRHWDDNSPVVTLVENEYFKANWHHLEAGDGVATTLKPNQKFHVLTCVRGMAIIRADKTQLTLPTGQTALVPATVASYTLSGAGDVICGWQPN
jgi:mannose-6-phosphate isomerase